MVKRRKKNRMPSVKEGMDNLPYGIAFADSYGIIILCNHSMHGISYALQNTELQNAELFWRRVEEQGERTLEGAYILRLEKGDIWLLSRRQCTLNGGLIYEITAQDVAERIRLIDMMSENNRHLASIGQRLREYNKIVLDVTRSRELLERKEHTHDELGKLLGATRHYLDGGEVDEEKLWRRWHINAALMLEETRLPKEEDLLDCLRRTASSAGVRLKLTGEQPDDARVLEIMLAAGGECVTNLLRHAKGEELCIHVEKREGADVLIFTNDGDAPAQEVKEGGGLSALRGRVEGMGGMMEIVSRPAYRLILTIPVEQKHQKDSGEFAGTDRES